MYNDISKFCLGEFVYTFFSYLLGFTYLLCITYLLIANFLLLITKETIIETIRFIMIPIKIVAKPIMMNSVIKSRLTDIIS